MTELTQPVSKATVARGARGARSVRGLAAAARGAGAMALAGSVVAITGGVLRVAPLFAVQSLRYACAALALVVFALAFRVRLVVPRGTEWVWLVPGSATGLVAFKVALVIGSAHADPAVLGAAVACVPIVLAVVSPLTRRRAPSVRIVVAAVVVALGAVAVEGGGHADGLGVAMAIVLMLCEAVFTLFGARVIGRLGPWTYSLGTTAIAAIGCGVISVVGERDQWQQLASWPMVLGILYAGAIATAVSYVLWFSSVGRVGAAVTGLTSGFAPPAAALVGLLFGASPPTPLGWLGMVAIGAGLAWGFSSPKAGVPRARPPRTTRSASTPEL
jgi:drug/metabolite transporter (DMT)-like permease